MAQKGQTKKSKKANVKANEEQKSTKTSGGICALQGPGPRYKLKPVLGFKDHCSSKYRNPAFSMLGKTLKANLGSRGPGPKYRLQFPPAGGFSFGIVLKDQRRDHFPGPYFIPPVAPTPAFSMKWRTKEREKAITPGPHGLPRDLNGPAFSMGLCLPSVKIGSVPGPGAIKLDIVKPRAPAYSFPFRPKTKRGLCTPGPYGPVNLNKAPAFSFGVKHHPCAPPYITECDQAC
ncbi:outer dense fiber protein 3-like [Fopius arisanus]|uniref:Outer dense fiber protein 3-like n=1 Tax=Fopius arisanus TaxID=64838 RepID=A0A9R1SWI8_9HYME|nr:PREDICTED: outer dense fiber protein 3-like [Fopius arisanus]